MLGSVSRFSISVADDRPLANFLRYEVRFTPATSCQITELLAMTEFDTMHSPSTPSTPSTKTNAITSQPRSFMQKLRMGGKKVAASSTDPSCEMGCDLSGIISNENELSFEEEDFNFFRLEGGQLGSQEGSLTPQQSSSPINEKKVAHVVSEDDFLWSNPTSH
jgi:hypothetical protein